MKNIGKIFVLPFFLTLLLGVALNTGHIKSSWAQSGAVDVERGRAMYQKGDFAEAASLLKNALPTISSGKDKASAHLLLGMIYLAQGQTDLSDAEFGHAVALDPKKKLAPEKYPPGVIRLYDQARLRSLGSIVVQTDPSDADIYIDGELRGLSPLPVNDLLAGAHSLKIVKEGYKTEEREFEVRETEQSEFYLELRITDEIPATITHQRIESASEGSSFRVKAAVQDNLGVVEVKLYFRKKGAAKYESLNMYQVQKGVYEGVAPRDKVLKEGLQYYITATDVGANITFEGKPENPFDVRVAELDRSAPRIFHTPVIASSDASVLEIKTKVIDNKKLAYVKLFFKRDGENKFFEEKLKDVSGAGDYKVTIPSLFMSAKQIYYYIEAADESGNIQYSGREAAPYVIKMFRALPYKNGYIVERKKRKDKWTKTVRVNVGTMKGYKKGQVLTIFSADEKVVDPESGMVLAINQELKGKVKITIPGPTSSEAKIIKEKKKYSIQKGDFIRFRPSPPTGVGGYSEKFQVITVTWNQNPEPEVAGYLIYRSNKPQGPFEKLKKISSRSTVQTIDKGSRKDKLVDGKKYFYKVKAYNYEKELSDFSDTGFVIAKGGPNPPTRFAAISGSIMQTPLVWERSADKETVGYTIFRSESQTGNYKRIARLTSSDRQEYVDKPDKRAGHDLEDGKTYWYRIVSYNREDKQGNMTEPVSGSSRQKPKPPANFRVVSSAVRSVSLAWDRHPDSEIKKYRIYRNAAADGDYQLIKEISDRSETEYTDKDKSGEKIRDGQKYYYRMTAVNSGGAESKMTTPVSGVTFGPPPAPTSIQAVSGMVKQVTISWKVISGSEVIGYAIYRGESPDALKPIKKLRRRNANQFKDAGGWDNRLKDGTKYYYTVRSINSVGVESMTQEIAEAVTKPVPVAPGGMSATQKKIGKTTLSWSRNAEPDIVSYRILRSEKPGGKFRAVGSTEKVVFEDVGLKNGASYYYQIQAIDKDGLIGEPSEIVEVVTKPVPAAPSGLEASAGLSSVTLSWMENQEPDIDHYVIYSVGIFGRHKIGTTKSSSYIVEKLKPGSTYSYVIVAVDKSKLSSEPSSPAQIKTLK